MQEHLVAREASLKPKKVCMHTRQSKKTKKNLLSFCAFVKSKLRIGIVSTDWGRTPDLLDPFMAACGRLGETTMSPETWSAENSKQRVSRVCAAHPFRSRKLLERVC
ncbi:hypothetical protein B5807_09475 [Epicoccum nigrum]|jgi:hypothetical protein|uniref:Uncharacterized protein n=1 Tax=Epicoccum nigrum TaxID=105696 RepID=A0A1Y2LPV9_EPING|nr:hypothetical protein B5807_09475 [Epicoccum nigrum]